MISPLRHPVSSNSRMIATTCGRPASWRASIAPRRRSSAAVRKRSRPWRRYRLMPTHGLVPSRPIPVDLGLAHDDRENGSRAVGGDRGLVKRCEPLLDVAGGDVGDGASLEPGENLVSVVVPVDPEGRRLPVSGVAPEDFVAHRLERGVRRCSGLVVVSIPDRGDQGSGPFAGLARADGLRAADDLPDPPAVVLSMYEKPLGARSRTLTPKPLSSRSRTS